MVEMCESSDAMIDRRTAASRLSRSRMTGLFSELFSRSFSRWRIEELYSSICAATALLVTDAMAGMSSPAFEGSLR